MARSVTIILWDPKYPHNVGGALRACSTLGSEEDGRRLLYSGRRVPAADADRKVYRLPREERLRDYRDVDIRRVERPLDLLEEGEVPVAVEVRENSELLPDFVHPPRAAYIFGPEDGSLPKAALTRCHRFVVIPSRSCLNLAASVNVVLYDRMVKGPDGQSGRGRASS